MDTTTIEYAFFEDAPFVSSYALPGAEPDRLHDDCAGLPVAFLEALGDLQDRPDNARCARCLDPAGFVLAEKANGFECMEWVPTGLARHGDGPVSVLCEHCTPYLPESEEDR